MDINLIQEEVFALIPGATDLLEANFDFTKGNGIEIKIGDSITDKIYCNDIDLEIQVVGLKENKIDLQSQAKRLDLNFNNHVFSLSDARIIRENVWYNSFYDKEKFVVVLMYKIRCYKRR